MKKQLLRQLSCMLILSALVAPQVMGQDSSYVGSDKKESARLFSGNRHYRTFSVGVNGGVLAPVVVTGGSNDFTKWKTSMGYGFYLKNQFSHHIALQADFLSGTLEGDNSKTLADGSTSESPYDSYKTHLRWAASLSGIVTFGNVNWFSEKNAVIPYLSVGGGVADYNTTLTLVDKTTVEYKSGENSKNFFIPVGIGLKFGLAPGVNMDLGYRMSFANADNLDGYAVGNQKDKFSYAFAGLEFAIGNKNNPQLMNVNPVATLKKDLRDQNDALNASLVATQQKADSNVALIGSLQNELVKLKGDADADGVSDYFDKCPGTLPGEKVDGSGCPLPKPPIVTEAPKVEITEDDRRIVNEAFKDLEFDLGKSTIRSASNATLDKVAELLVTKDFSLKISGHTDDVGSESANMKLSKERAESLKEYLVSKGANPSRIEATGYGEAQPIASNKTAEGRQKNRRVEFTLY